MHKAWQPCIHVQTGNSLQMFYGIPRHLKIAMTTIHSVKSIIDIGDVYILTEARKATCHVRKVSHFEALLYHSEGFRTALVFFSAGSPGSRSNPLSG